MSYDIISLDCNKNVLFRKINVYDTNIEVFRKFLNFVYSGSTSDLLKSNSEQSSEMLLLADRYDMDDLKDICEANLKDKIDTGSQQAKSQHFHKISQTCYRYNSVTSWDTVQIKQC